MHLHAELGLLSSVLKASSILKLAYILQLLSCFNGQRAFMYMTTIVFKPVPVPDAMKAKARKLLRDRSPHNLLTPCLSHTQSFALLRFRRAAIGSKTPADLPP